MKTLNPKNVAERKANAGTLARDASRDFNRQNRFKPRTLEERFMNRNARTANARGATNMAVPTRRELLDRIEELETENEEMQCRLDEIADLVGEEEEPEQGNQ